MKYSKTLQGRILFVVERAIGSNGVLAFYSGEPPETADDEPTGEKLGTRALTPAELGALRNGTQPEMMQGASYWRLLDNGGLVVMQGGADE
jgi:hypothetical protein